MTRRRFAVGISVIVVLLFVTFWGASSFIYVQFSSVHPRCEDRDQEINYTPDNFVKEGADLTPYLMDTFEDVRIPSRDKDITIAAWFIPAQNVEDVAATPTVIIVHGLNDCRHRPHSLTPAGMLTHAGFNALVMDLREHGDSTIEDGRTALGTEEYRDVLGVWDWLQATKGIPAERIGLFGYSLGAGTVMIATGEEPRVAAVWEDSGWGDNRELIDDELANNGLPTFLGYGARLVGQIISGDDILSLSPLGAMSKLNGRPIFIVHGDADERVDVHYAFDLAEAASANGNPVEPWIVPGAAHIEPMFVLTAEYEQHLITFFSDHLASE